MTERQVKKHVHAKPQTIRVDSGPGWRGVLEDEIKEVLESPVQVYKFKPEVKAVDDGIEVHSLDFRQMLELPLRLLTASEIFWQIDSKHVGSFGEFESFIRSIDWSLYLPPDARVKVRSYSYRSTLYHEGKLDRIARGILTEAGFHEKDFEYIVRIEQRENRCTAFLALSAEPLFRRRYKSDFSHPAPLQEHLAASAIRWAAGSEKADFICVPFAGSGTLLMESCLYFTKPSLDIWRPFSCVEKLPEFPRSSWDFIRKKLESDRKVIPAQGIEIDRQGTEILKKNLAHAEQGWPALQKQWSVSQSDFALEKVAEDKTEIFLPLNPPYGLRLEEDTQGLYRKLGRWIRQNFSVKQKRFGFVFVADSKSYHAFEKEIGTENIKGIQSFTQGGQHIRCVRFLIPAEA